MRYVFCPNPECGDPVVVELAKELTCIHCKEKFLLDESQVLTGPIWRDEKAHRWKVGVPRRG